VTISPLAHIHDRVKRHSGPGRNSRDPISRRLVGSMSQTSIQIAAIAAYPISLTPHNSLHCYSFLCTYRYRKTRPDPFIVCLPCIEKRRTIVPEPSMRFFVTCPECALESTSHIPIAVIADGLLTRKAIRLHASCHDVYWTATFVEREQLRQLLRAIKDDTEPQLASDSPDAKLVSNCP
jgi:hypothetical protein